MIGSVTYHSLGSSLLQLVAPWYTLAKQLHSSLHEATDFKAVSSSALKDTGVAILAIGVDRSRDKESVAQTLLLPTHVTIYDVKGHQSEPFHSRVIRGMPRVCTIFGVISLSGAPLSRRKSASASTPTVFPSQRPQ